MSWWVASPGWTLTLRRHNKQQGVGVGNDIRYLMEFSHHIADVRSFQRNFNTTRRRRWVSRVALGKNDATVARITSAIERPRSQLVIRRLTNTIRTFRQVPCIVRTVGTAAEVADCEATGETAWSLVESVTEHRALRDGEATRLRSEMVIDDNARNTAAK